LKEFFR